MASSINASTSGGGGIITTADATGNLNIQSGGSTVVAVTSAGAAVTGTLSATGAVSGTTGTFTSTLGVTGAITGSSTVAGSTGILYPLTSGTAVASTSGTSIDFTGIPSWVKRVTCMFNGVSASGTSAPMIQLGTSGGVVTSGYSNNIALITNVNNTTRGAANTNGIAITWTGGANNYSYNGSVVFVTTGSNSWVASGVVNNTPGIETIMTAGQISLGATLDRVRFTMINGTDTFDAGSVNILYE